MAEAEKLTSDQWVEKFDASKMRYLQRVAKMKNEVRADASLPDLDRAVLGVTGSPKELQRYRQMATWVNESIGGPIVVIEAGDSDTPLSALGGLITGAVKVELFTDDIERNVTRSHLHVPIVNGFRWYRNEGIEDCSHRSSIDIARFDAAIVPAAPGKDSQYFTGISPEVVLIGDQVGNRGPYAFRVEQTKVVNDVMAQFGQFNCPQIA